MISNCRSSLLLIILFLPALVLSTTGKDIGGFYNSNDQDQRRLLRTRGAAKINDGDGDSKINCTEAERTTGVFVNLNQLENNEVASFRRKCDGSGQLEHVGNYATGGQGFPYKNDILLPDNPLGTQNALRVEGRYVFVVNAGSNSFSQLQIDEKTMELTLVSVTPTQGTFPCTLDARLDLGIVCVATCGGPGSLGCYEIAPEAVDETGDRAMELEETSDDGGGQLPELKLVHHVDTMGIPVGPLPSGNPEDPFNPEGDGNGRPGINVLLNIKQVQFTPDGDALYMTVFNKGLYLFPTTNHTATTTTTTTLDEPILFSVDEGDLALQHRPFSFQFQKTSTNEQLLHIQDPFATTAAELFFPPNIGIGLSAGGTLSTYKVLGSGLNTSLEILNPQIGAGQKGACWVAYNNGTIAVTNTASGTVTVYRELDFLGEGIYDVAAADMLATRRDTGIVGFNAGPFASSGGSAISSLPVDVTFSRDAEYFYVLNAAVAVVDIYSVDASENSIQDSGNRATHVGFVEIPGVVPPTSDKTIAGNDTEWQRQIDVWGAWSSAAGLQGIAAFPK